MSAIAKGRLYTWLCSGFFVGGLLAAVSCILWLKFGQEFADRTFKPPTRTVGTTQTSLKSAGSEVPDLYRLTESFSGFELTASLYSSLLAKDENELLRILEQSKSIESEIARRSVQSVVFERLVHIDPSMALRHALVLRGQSRIESLKIVFQEWAILELNAAVSSGVRLAHPFARVALKSILRARIDLSEESQQEIVLQFGEEDFMQRESAKERTWLRTQSPEEAWNTAIRDGKRLTTRVGLLASIAEVWWRHEGAGILQKIVESTEPGSDQWTSERLIALRLVAQGLAEHAPQEIFDQATKLSTQSRDALLHAIAEHWSQFDPHKALVAVSSYEMENRRKTLTRTVAQSWARSSPMDMFAISGSFDQSVQAIVMEEAVLGIGRFNRDEALKLLQSAESTGFDVTRVKGTFFADWTKDDPLAVVQWILTKDELDEFERERILKVVLENLVQVDSQLAVELTMVHRTDASVQGIEETLFRSLVHTDVEAAISLLPSLRDESRPAAISTIGGALVFGNSPLRALEMGDLLTENQRSDYYPRVFHQWALLNPKDLMKSINSLATTEQKNLAAGALTQTHSTNPVLSLEELEYVKAYLIEK